MCFYRSVMYTLCINGIVQRFSLLSCCNKMMILFSCTWIMFSTLVSLIMFFNSVFCQWNREGFTSLITLIFFKMMASVLKVEVKRLALTVLFHQICAIFKQQYKRQKWNPMTVRAVAELDGECQQEGEGGRTEFRGARRQFVLTTWIIFPLSKKNFDNIWFSKLTI